MFTIQFVKIEFAWHKVLHSFYQKSIRFISPLRINQWKNSPTIDVMSGIEKKILLFDWRKDYLLSVSAQWILLDSLSDQKVLFHQKRLLFRANIQPITRCSRVWMVSCVENPATGKPKRQMKYFQYIFHGKTTFLSINIRSNTRNSERETVHSCRYSSVSDKIVAFSLLAFSSQFR